MARIGLKSKGEDLAGGHGLGSRAKQVGANQVGPALETLRIERTIQRRPGNGQHHPEQGQDEQQFEQGEGAAAARGRARSVSPREAPGLRKTPLWE
jgi:hypothetical protein